LLEGLNDVLAKARVITDNTTARAVLTGEMPMVELNALKASGKQLEPLVETPLLKVVYGDQALADYERLRTAPEAFTPHSLAKEFPETVKTVDAPRFTPPGYTYSPTNRVGMNYAKGVAAGAVTDDGFKSAKAFAKASVDPATPIADAIATRHHLQSPGPGNAEKGFMKSANTYGAERVHTAPKSQSKKVVNLTKRFGLKKFVAMIPVIGAAVDVTMGVSDLLKGTSALISGEAGAAEHFQNAAAHGGDALLGGLVVGEVLNIGANAAGHDGFVSMLESELDD
jgi:hypothetical protein